MSKYTALRKDIDSLPFPYDCSNVFYMISSAFAKQNCLANRILCPQFIHPCLKILNVKDFSKRM